MNRTAKGVLLFLVGLLLQLLGLAMANPEAAMERLKAAELRERRATPFLKILYAMAAAVVATYTLVLSGTENPTFMDAFHNMLLASLLLAAALVATIFCMWAGIELIAAGLNRGRKVPPGEGTKTVIVGFLGVFLFEALRKLAADDQGQYLATFSTVLAGILVALAVETRKAAAPSQS